MNIKKYLVLRDREIDGRAFCSEGDIVYECCGDYGLAAMDSRMTGIRHISVTREKTGAGPYFTIPYSDLREVHSRLLGSPT